MYIVNTSFMVDGTIHNQFLELLTDKYIPFLRQQGYEGILFTRVVSIEATDQFTYSLQVEAEGIPDFQRLTGEIFAEYESIAQGVFGAKVLHFHSLLKKIDVNPTKITHR